MPGLRLRKVRKDPLLTQPILSPVTPWWVSAGTSKEGRPSYFDIAVCRPDKGTTQRRGCSDYPRESCNIAYNTPKMLTKMNTSIKETMIVLHPPSLFYKDTLSR